MKRSLATSRAIETNPCFVPIQSFDLASQDPLLDLFDDDVIKPEITTTTHFLQPPPRPQTQSQAAPTDVAHSLVFLHAALPAPLELAPPVKRRKRRVTCPPKHVQDLAKLQEQQTASDASSDSELGGGIKLQMRKIKNRASAAKSRIKAQARQEQLEKNLVELHQQNTYLRELVVAMAKASGQPLPVLPPLQAVAHSDDAAFTVAL